MTSLESLAGASLTVEDTTGVGCSAGCSSWQEYFLGL